MTRYLEYSGGMDGAYFFEYHCDQCDKTIQLAEGEDLPNGWLWVGVEKDNPSTGHVCPSCRYAGAVDVVTVLRVSTTIEDLQQAGSKASKILMHKDLPPQVKHAARAVINDLQLCVEKLKKVYVATEGVSA